MIFCTEYVRGNVRYRCYLNFCDNGHYYDWMLINYNDGNDYPCKLIVCIPGEYNTFGGYQLIVQEEKRKRMKVQFYFKITSFLQI